LRGKKEVTGERWFAKWREREGRRRGGEEGVGDGDSPGHHGAVGRIISAILGC